MPTRVNSVSQNPGTFTKKVTVSTPSTMVKKIVVGTPVRRVSSDTLTIASLGDTDVSGISDGCLLVYDASSGKWVSQLDIDNNQNINGGSY